LHCKSFFLSGVCKKLCGQCVVVLTFIFISGCAVTEYQSKWSDDDKDGVANIADKCPESVEALVVNRHGCSLFSGTLEGVDFETNELVLNETAYPTLDELASGLIEYPETIVGVHAHTDNRGKARLNLELSKLRVMKVVEYLVDKGVAGRQLKPYGYGESRPLVSNATADGRLRNRRIDVVLLKGQTGQPLPLETVGDL